MITTKDRTWRVQILAERDRGANYTIEFFREETKEYSDDGSEYTTATATVRRTRDQVGSQLLPITFPANPTFDDVVRMLFRYGKKFHEEDKLTPMEP